MAGKQLSNKKKIKEFFGKKVSADIAGAPLNAQASGNQIALLRMGYEERNAHNNTGIPDSLKTSAEQKTGVSLDDVRVHYNSPRPMAVGALAYTQGNRIYMGSGQERHLSHELAHVVQQKQGRVRATGSVGGQPLNDDATLEREADYFL